MPTTAKPVDRHFARKQPAPAFAAAVALAALLTACGDTIVDPKLPAGAVQFTPPSYFTTWWDMTKACSGRSGSLNDITWYVVPAGVPLELDDELVSAYWSAASNRIVLSAAVQDNGQVVRHEMLHALLASKGHSRQDYLEDCGGYVSCSSKCVADAGPAPIVPASVPRVSPTALEVGMTIAPNVIRSWENAGYFAVTVQARNPAAHPVLVVLPSPVSFLYQFVGPSGEVGSVPVLDEGVQSFAAGETKVHVFDFFDDFQGALPGHLFPGNYGLTTGFAGHTTPVRSVQLF